MAAKDIMVSAAACSAVLAGVVTVISVGIGDGAVVTVVVGEGAAAAGRECGVAPAAMPCLNGTTEPTPS